VKTSLVFRELQHYRTRLCGYPWQVHPQSPTSTPRGSGLGCGATFSDQWSVALPPLAAVLHARSDGSRGTPLTSTALTAGGL